MRWCSKMGSLPAISWPGPTRRISWVMAMPGRSHQKRWFEEGKIKPHVSNVVPLAEAGRALDLLESRRATGKVVVAV